MLPTSASYPAAANSNTRHWRSHTTPPIYRPPPGQIVANKHKLFPASTLIPSIPSYGSRSTISTSTVRFCRPEIHVNDQDLRQRARETHDWIDFCELINTSSKCDHWQWHSSENGLDLFQRKSPKDQLFEVVVMGMIENCSSDELLTLLRGLTEREHNMTMLRLFKGAFIAGSVIREIPFLHHAPTTLATEQLSVKTICFARHSVFSKNEQWTYLENLRRARDGSAQLTLSSMNIGEVTLDAALQKRVDQLFGIRVSVSIKPLATARKSLQVLVHCRFDDSQQDSAPAFSNYASFQTIKARLFAIAKAMKTLPTMLTTHNIGMEHSTTDPRVLNAGNSYCPCCTKHLCYFSKKKRCCECGFNVCDRCWTVQIASAGEDRAMRPIVVCRQCLKNEDAFSSEYEHQSLLTSIKLRKLGDEVKTDYELVEILEQFAQSSSGSKRTTAMSVTRQLLDQDVSSSNNDRWSRNAVFSSSTSRCNFNNSYAGEQQPMFARTTVPRRKVSLYIPENAQQTMLEDASRPREERDRRNISRKNYSLCTRDLQGTTRPRTKVNYYGPA